MNANVIVIFIYFIISGFFHQGLYILFPLLTFYYISYQKGSKLKLNPISKIYLYVVLVALTLFTLQSIFYFDIKIFSIKGCLRYFAYFSFAVFVSYTSKENIKYFFVILIAFFIITLPLAFYQIAHYGRYQNVLGHSNHLAYVLSMLIYFLIFNRPFKNRNINITCILLLLVSLLLTKSSGGLLVLIVLLGYNGIVSKRFSLKKKIIFSSLPLIAVIIALNVSEKIAFQFESINFLSWEFIEKKATEFNIDGVSVAGNYGSFVWRILYWFAIIYEFLSESFTKIILGLGIDHCTKGNLPYKFMRHDPHNDFVKVLTEFGAIGVVLYVGFFRKIYKVVNKNFNVIIIMLIPAFFGNPIVNFSVSMTLILILMYEYKKVYS